MIKNRKFSIFNPYHKRLIFLLGLSLLQSGISGAQDSKSVFNKKNYPTSDFKSPVKFPIELAGNFGECRPDHFHSGIDIKTKGKENLPIYTASAGYISRIKISHTGFGNALYISHPNGYTTLYAHLNSFNSKIGKWVESEQYKQNKWDIDVELQAYELPVFENEQIALSGNTGSSLAPHLHFEIRDTKTENPVNPSLFGFKIEDTTPPKLNSIGIYNLHNEKNFYYLTPQFIPFSNNKNLGLIEVNFDKVGISVNALDMANINSGKLGVFEAQLYVDNKLYFAWQTDNISYNETRYLHAMVDYPTYIKKNEWYQCLFLQPGNLLKIYQNLQNNNGIINLEDLKIHDIKIVLLDVSGNIKTFTFQLKSKLPLDNSPSCNHSQKFDQISRWTTSNLDLEFKPNTFYRDMCIFIRQQNHKFIIGDEKIPLHKSYVMTFKNSDFSKNEKYYIEQSNAQGKILKGFAASVETKTLTCDKFREFGNFSIKTDHSAPTIIVNIKNGAKIKSGQLIKVEIEEKETSIGHISISINNQWLCFARKNNSFFYKVDNHFPKGKSILTVKCSDENNNSNIQKINLNY